ncbi:MAG: c-type cytochrome biogenesis protein CcsB [Neisseriaceae bacterium]|nr:c-type cytochrome biogenesis protein CcsB [Neisseriaceae bacterium]
MNKENELIQNHVLLKKRGILNSLDIGDYIYAVIVIIISMIIRFSLLHSTPDIYEEVIFWCAMASIIALGCFFKSLRWFFPLSALLTYFSILLYNGDYTAGSQRFLLKYILSSQSAIMWQCCLIVLAFIAFLIGAISTIRYKASQRNTAVMMGSGIAWAAALMGTVGLLVRWHESYLIGNGAGHIPVSNLYEVMILFMIMIALMFLYYAQKNQLHRLGVFVYLLQSLLVAFFVWYSNGNTGNIQPLVPALQSWWMKIHVPSSFVGYGGFCLAAMLAIAQLLAIRNENNNTTSSFLPNSIVIEEVMYKSIAVGFLFFTISTILGALWAADAWGRYWGWDPKETWALIVWLNYAVWLHMRLVAGWRGKILAWWAVVSLLITMFAFIGVNKYLTGLHSYGGL